MAKVKNMVIREKEQLYESIVQDIRSMYGNSLSELEIHQAARNLIEFVRELMK